VILTFLMLAPVFLFWLTWRVRKGARYSLRRIPAFESLHGLLGVVTESGKKVHVSLGNAEIGGDQTSALSMGLTVLRSLADQGASLGAMPVVTVADPALMIMAQDMLYRAYERKGQSAQYQATDVHMIAPNASAYAVGVQDTLDDEEVMANVMVGPFGDEFLLMAETGAQREMVQILGSNAVGAQPFMVATSDHVLVGEEFYAAGAYLTERPEHVASLRLQDGLRVLIAVAIVIGVLVKTLLG
jgi:hypothetical protein